MLQLLVVKFTIHAGKFYSGTDVGSRVETVFSYTGADQNFALPASATLIEVKLWAGGAMGGGGNGSPGPQGGGGGGGAAMKGFYSQY